MSSAANPGPRLRLAASWLLALGLAGAATIGPAVAEAKLDAQLRERLGLDEAFSVDINLSNIELRSLSRVFPGEDTRLSAELVRVRPTFSGVFIELEGLRAERDSQTAAMTRANDDAPPSPAKHTDTIERAPTKDALAAMLQRLRGVPLDIRHDGPIELELERGLWLRASELHVELPGDGQIRAAAELGAGPVRSAAPTYFDARVSLTTDDEHPRELELEGTLLDHARLPALSFSGAASPTRIDLALEAAAGGSATIAATRDAATDHAHLRLDAERFPLAQLEPLTAALLDHLAPIPGLARLGSAQIDGALELDARARDDLRLQLDALELRNFELDAELLAPAPVHIDALTLDGELAREPGRAGPESFATLVLAHRGVRASASAQLTPAGLSFDLQMPPSPCQAVFDALPGISPVLAGTELEGELAAHVGLDLDFAALAEARAQFQADGGASFDLDTFEPPGALRFDLPYLQACEITRLGPGVDLDGLRGAYRHDFQTANGQTKRRVLAHGDEGFVAITKIPTLALAFVILEDSMFYRHDGFDREQLERAFWFNVLEGRVRRGASTITQQAARTLWLGIDRSISRKLAEAMLAAELERELGKRRILEIYLNLIELGPGVHGVAEAAEYHFGKSAQQLSLIESLHLASLAPAPVAYSRRFAHGKLDAQWREHLRLQVRRLQLRKLISPEQAQRAVRLALELRAH